eukprot:gene49837-66759_t
MSYSSTTASAAPLPEGQLRVHALHIGHPIIGDPKYFIDDHNWDFPGGVQKRLHLHARYIDLPHPNGGRLKVTAPLPPHMVQTWNLLGLDQRDVMRQTFRDFHKPEPEFATTKSIIGLTLVIAIVRMDGKPLVDDEAVAMAGIDRTQVYVTNAVKHFKHERRGKRRLHMRPEAGEVAHCRWWLAKEVEVIKPKIIVALGATAYLALT